MHRKRKKEEERSQLNDISLEDYIESMFKYSKTYYVSSQINIKQITTVMERKKYYESDMHDRWNYKNRVSFVQSLSEIDYARFKIGYHLVNKIPTLYKLFQMKNVVKM